jgi:hypothetical protein
MSVLRFSSLILLVSATVAAAGCARSVIPNTDVDDSAENREVVEFIERYRLAVEERNVGRILSLCSERYFDDNGTPGGQDDLDYEGLQGKLARKVCSTSATTSAPARHFCETTSTCRRLHLRRALPGQHGGERWARCPRQLHRLGVKKANTGFSAA